MENLVGLIFSTVWTYIILKLCKKDWQLYIGGALCTLIMDLILTLGA